MAKRNQSGMESEYHVVATRMRVVGEGNLQLALTDLNQIQTQNLVDLAMTPTTRFEPTRLANFQSQRVRLEGQVTEIDEWFKIDRIILFVKPVAVEYPG